MTAQFAKVPAGLAAAVSAGTVKPATLAFYVHMRLHWWGDKVEVKQKTMAEELGYSQTTVEDHIRSLKKSGWLIAERKPMVHGVNLYYFPDVEPFVKPVVTAKPKKSAPMRSKPRVVTHAGFNSPAEKQKRREHVEAKSGATRESVAWSEIEASLGDMDW
ncbi:hypothetical protein [Micromonospora chokoriensis]